MPKDEKYFFEMCKKYFCFSLVACKRVPIHRDLAPDERIFETVINLVSACCVLLNPRSPKALF